MASGPGGRVRDDALEQGPGPSGGARGLVVGGGEDLRGGPARGQDASVEDLLQGRGEEPGERGQVTAEDDGRDVEDIDGGAQGDPQGVGGGIDARRARS